MFEVVSSIKFSFNATVNLSFNSSSTYILKVFKNGFQCVFALLNKMHSGHIAHLCNNSCNFDQIGITESYSKYLDN